MKNSFLFLIVLMLTSQLSAQEINLEANKLKKKWYSLNTIEWVSSDEKAFLVGWRGVFEISKNPKFLKISKRMYKNCFTLGSNATKYDKKNNCLVVINKKTANLDNMYVGRISMKDGKSTAFKLKNLSVSSGYHLVESNETIILVERSESYLKLFKIDFENKKVIQTSKIDINKEDRFIRGPKNEFFIVKNEGEKSSYTISLHSLNFDSKELEELYSMNYEIEDEEGIDAVNLNFNNLSQVVLTSSKIVSIGNKTFKRVHHIYELDFESKKVVERIIDDETLKFQNESNYSGLRVDFLQNKIIYTESNKVEIVKDNKSQVFVLEYKFSNKSEYENVLHSTDFKALEFYSQISETLKNEIKVAREGYNNRVSFNLFGEELIVNIYTAKGKGGKFYGVWKQYKVPFEFKLSE
jgi:hypothetical protein